ncbi:MAG TPA: nucleotidyl transferase AbiEii/AbiGii toxin family protein [Chthoniobacterales bacterium]|jgi:hypothetical protein
MIKLASLEQIVRTLNAQGVRFLIAGGVAVNGYGYLRVTKDLDIAVALDAQAFHAAVIALESIGYAPKIPVTAEMIADPANRERWRAEKGMLVFQMWNDSHRETPIDIFTTLPFDFETAFASSIEENLAPGLEVRLVPLDLLIAMKQEAARPRDLDDIDHLRQIQSIRAEKNG